MNKLFIHHLHVPTIIGVHPHEQQSAQELVLNITWQVDTRAAAITDDIKATINYSEVAASVLTWAQARSFQLIESFAEYIIDHLCDTFRPTWIQLVVKKSSALAQADCAGVMIERSYEGPPTSS